MTAPEPLLTLTMIVRDEEAAIANVLGDATGFCDQLVVVDTGSRDRTVDIARACGAEVYHFDWIDDFAAARNSSLPHCRGEWIIYLDADDRVPPLAQLGFRALKERLRGRDDIDVVVAGYRYAFHPPDSDNCVLNMPVARMFRRASGLRWIGRVHETLVTDEQRTLSAEEVWVDHRPNADSRKGKPDRNLRLLEAALAAGDRSVRTRYFRVVELMALGRRAEAIEASRELLSENLHPEERYRTLLNLAGCLMDPEHEDERLACLREAAATVPEHAGAHVQIGLHFYARGRWAEAVPHFEAAEACSPSPYETYSEMYYSWFPPDCLAKCLSELGRYAEAIEATMRAMPSNPNPERLQANLAFYRAQLARQMESSNDGE